MYGYDDTTGEYNLYFTRAPGANEHGLLTNDGVHTGTIDLGDIDSYTFTADSGDYIRLSMAETSDEGGFYPKILLIGPTDGTVLASDGGSAVATISYTASETGTYTVLVCAYYNYTNATGDYNLYFARVPGANEHGLLSNDGVHTGTIDLGDIDSYTFTADSGDYIRLSMAETSDDEGLSPGILMIGPTDGTVLADDIDDSSASIDGLAAKTGTYTVIVFGGSGTTGNYSLNLSRTSVKILISGRVHQDQVDVAGDFDLFDFDVYFFKAYAGETVTVTMTDTSGSELFWPVILPYDPSGNPITSTTYGDEVATAVFTASETGLYKLLAGNFSENTGTYEYEISYVNDASVQGDLNGDGKLDLADAILAMKILVDMDSTIVHFSDVNGDDAIGLPEVLYILRTYAN